MKNKILNIGMIILLLAVLSLLFLPNLGYLKANEKTPDRFIIQTQEVYGIPGRWTKILVAKDITTRVEYMIVICNDGVAVTKMQPKLMLD